MRYKADTKGLSSTTSTQAAGCEAAGPHLLGDPGYPTSLYFPSHSIWKIENSRSAGRSILVEN